MDPRTNYENYYAVLFDDFDYSNLFVDACIH